MKRDEYADMLSRLIAYNPAAPYLEIKPDFDDLMAEYDRVNSERDGLAEISGRLAVECGIYKQALEKIHYSCSPGGNEPDEGAFQIALEALNRVNRFVVRTVNK